MEAIVRKPISLLAAFVILVLTANFLYVSWPAYSRAASDPRNEKVRIASYLRWGIDPSTLVVDIWSVNSGAAMIDVDRGLLEVAAALKDRSFSYIILSYRGQPRFRLTGQYFKKLGEERDWQNPVYTIRTLAENLQTPEGMAAFPTWTGGMLGVLNKQMEDHKEFHLRWYANYL